MICLFNANKGDYGGYGNNYEGGYGGGGRGGRGKGTAWCEFCFVSSIIV